MWCAVCPITLGASGLARRRVLDLDGRLARFSSGCVARGEKKGEGYLTKTLLAGGRLIVTTSAREETAITEGCRDRDRTTGPILAQITLLLVADAHGFSLLGAVRANSAAGLCPLAAGDSGLVTGGPWPLHGPYHGAPCPPSGAFEDAAWRTIDGNAKPIGSPGRIQVVRTLPHGDQEVARAAQVAPGDQDRQWQPLGCEDPLRCEVPPLNPAFGAAPRRRRKSHDHETR